MRLNLAVHQSHAFLDSQEMIEDRHNTFFY